MAVYLLWRLVRAYERRAVLEEERVPPAGTTCRRDFCWICPWGECRGGFR